MVPKVSHKILEIVDLELYTPYQMSY